MPTLLSEPLARAQRMDAQAHTPAHRLIAVIIEAGRGTSRSEPWKMH